MDHGAERGLWRIARPLLLVVLVAQMLLPAAHAIKVARVDAPKDARQACAVAERARTVAEALKSRSHDPASCSVCSILARANGAAPPTAAERLHAPTDARTRVQLALEAPGSVVRTGPPPRAPPTSPRFLA